MNYGLWCEVEGCNGTCKPGEHEKKETVKLDIYGNPYCTECNQYNYIFNGVCTNTRHSTAKIAKTMKYKPYR